MQNIRLDPLAGKRVLFKLRGECAIEREVLAIDPDGYWIRDDARPYILGSDIEWFVAADSPYITLAMRERI